ncbi:MAG: hypothetical protein JSS91_00930 [Bacteroidetes bacterium]|nr:hypothetical protein [Bacteroidota bacterium]
MKLPIEDKVLEAIRMVWYATIYNFQPFLNTKATNLTNGLLWTTKVFNKLKKQKRIQKIGLYPFFGRMYRYNQFYEVNRMKHDKWDTFDRNPIFSLASSLAMHQSGVRDILIGFIFLYPDYEVVIKIEPIFNFDYKKYCEKNPDVDEKKVGWTYRPDAWVKLISKDNKKEYDFIIEFERTKRPMDIKMNKLEKIECLNLKECGLSHFTKFLIFFTYQQYNAYWRPIEYDEPEVKKEIEAVENRLNQLLTYAKEYPEPRYRFIPFHDFYRLNEAVWYTPEGKKVQLINL